MERVDLAILLSVASMIIAAFSLGWNVYRDVCLKAKVTVSFTLQSICHGGVTIHNLVGIEATNHGPGPVKLMSIILRPPHRYFILRPKTYTFLVHDYTSPYSGSLPAELGVGDRINLFVKFDEKCFLREDLAWLGMTDTFGRTHRAPRKMMREMRSDWLVKFGQSN
jgi:hypothetical protein